VAQLTVDVDQGAVPLTVELDGSSSFDPDGRVVGWRWDFGDGSSGQGKIVSHTYTQSGAYTITLTVTDNLGVTASQQLQISAGKLALVAAFFATPGSGWAPLQVQFDASESQAPRGATYE